MRRIKVRYWHFGRRVCNWWISLFEYFHEVAVSCSSASERTVQCWISEFHVLCTWCDVVTLNGPIKIVMRDVAIKSFEIDEFFWFIFSIVVVLNFFGILLFLDDPFWEPLRQDPYCKKCFFFFFNFQVIWNALCFYLFFYQFYTNSKTFVCCLVWFENHWLILL